MPKVSSLSIALLAAVLYLVSSASAFAEAPLQATYPAPNPSAPPTHEGSSQAKVTAPSATTQVAMLTGVSSGWGTAPSAGVDSASDDPVLVCKNDGDAAPGTTATAAGEKEWPWRRAGVADYVSVAALAAGTIYFEAQNGKPGKAHWTSRNGFDEGIRDALRLESRGARDVTHEVSNVIMGVMIAAPVLESGAVLGLRDSKWDALWQTEMINIESFTFTSLVSSLMQNLIARERPFVRNCREGECEGVQKNRSMPSGHVAFAFTGAGLLCTHHKYQDFYGDETTDSAICATGLGVAAVDGVLRILADRHYATDVLAGTAIGLISGFVLPRILFYPWHSPPQEKKAEGTDKSIIKGFSFAPEVYSDGGGVNCAFKF